MAVEKILIIYIGIVSVKPLVVEKISVRRRWYLIILRFSWSKRWGSLGEIFVHLGSYGLNQGNPLKKIKSHSQLPNIYFSIIFWFNFSSFQGPQIWNLIILRFFWSKRWGYLGKFLAIEAAKTWNRVIPCKNLKLVATTYFFLFLIISGSTELIFYYNEGFL